MLLKSRFNVIDRFSETVQVTALENMHKWVFRQEIKLVALPLIGMLQVVVSATELRPLKIISCCCIIYISLLAKEVWCPL